jgi:uncharacterized protein (UPF0335 family)
MIPHNGHSAVANKRLQCSGLAIPAGWNADVEFAENQINWMQGHVRKICVAPDDQATHSFAKDQLKAIVERIERIEEERKTISDDIMDVYSEASANERFEQEPVLDTYL